MKESWKHSSRAMTWKKLLEEYSYSEEETYHDVCDCGECEGTMTVTHNVWHAPKPLLNKSGWEVYYVKGDYVWCSALDFGRFTLPQCIGMQPTEDFADEWPAWIIHELSSRGKLYACN